MASYKSAPLTIRESTIGILNFKRWGVLGSIDNGGCWAQLIMHPTCTIQLDFKNTRKLTKRLLASRS